MSEKKTSELLGKHFFVFNKKDNGGEQLCLATNICSNGDPFPDGIYLEQELTLQSYCNSASFSLLGAPITSNQLRKLADELDQKIFEIKAKLTAKKENIK